MKCGSISSVLKIYKTYTKLLFCFRMPSFPATPKTGWSTGSGNIPYRSQRQGGATNTDFLHSTPVSWNSNAVNNNETRDLADASSIEPKPDLDYLQAYMIAQSQKNLKNYSMMNGQSGDNFLSAYDLSNILPALQEANSNLELSQSSNVRNESLSQTPASINSQYFQNQSSCNSSVQFSPFDKKGSARRSLRFEESRLDANDNLVQFHPNTSVPPPTFNSKAFQMNKENMQPFQAQKKEDVVWRDPNNENGVSKQYGRGTDKIDALKSSQRLTNYDSPVPASLPLSVELPTSTSQEKPPASGSYSAKISQTESHTPSSFYGSQSTMSGQSTPSSSGDSGFQVCFFFKLGGYTCI